MCPASAFWVLLPWCAHASVAVVLVTLPSKPVKLNSNLYTALLHMQLLPDAASTVQCGHAKQAIIAGLQEIAT